MPFACLGGVEVANLARVTSYGAGECFDACPCPALDEDIFTGIAADPAPWYDVDHPESENFLGFLPESITLSPPASRSSSPIATEGSFLGRERLNGRVVEVVGWMVARDFNSMWYGERWLTEALRGNRCQECANDTLTVLPYCRDEGEGFDYSDDFRSLVGTALVDGPRFTELSDDPDYMIVRTQFQFVSAMPWLYHSAVRCIDQEPLTDILACSLTTPGWTEEGTFVIDITNNGTLDATDIVITGQISLDGSCPVDPPGSSVPPTFVYTIPTLGPEDRIVIDGTRRQALYYDASSRVASSALSRLEWEGPLIWPDVGSCTTICLTVESFGNYGADADVTVDSYLREL